MKCPHWNKDIEMTPILQLKQHITTHIAKMVSLLARYDNVHGGAWDGRVKSQEVIDKWKSWLNAITELENK